jgi:hypothetical protein
MRVQFEFTQEDLVDASKRLLKHRRLERSKAWKTSLYSALSVGVIIFFFVRNKPAIGLLLGLVGGLIMLIYPRLEKSALDRRLRRVVAELMRDPGPYVCEVEIRSEGIWVRQMNTQITHEWRGLEAIEETSDSVDIFARWRRRNRSQSRIRIRRRAEAIY